MKTNNSVGEKGKRKEVMAKAYDGVDYPVNDDRGNACEVCNGIKVAVQAMKDYSIMNMH
jgi:hypothetical protein